MPIGSLKRAGSFGTSDAWYGDSFNGYLAGHFPNDTRLADNTATATLVPETPR